MDVIVNNLSKHVISNNLQELIEELTIETNGVAIALNNRVIPRSEWSLTILKEGDNIVVVSAVFGG